MRELGLIVIGFCAGFSIAVAVCQTMIFNSHDRAERLRDALSSCDHALDVETHARFDCQQRKP